MYTSHQPVTIFIVGENYGQRNTRGHLDRETIANCAVALVDSEGIDAITIRRLAKELAVTAMALYRHFQNKDEILNAIVEYLLAQVELPPPSQVSWDEELAIILERFVEVLRVHPNAADLVVSRILLSIPGLILSDRVLGLIRTGGFAREHVAQIATYALSSLVALVSTKPGRITTSDLAEQDAFLRSKKAALASLSPQTYPNIIAMADFLTSCTDDNLYYDLGVKLVIAGAKGVSKGNFTS